LIPITRRMALLVTTAALLPLLIFGIVAGYTLRTTTRDSVMENMTESRVVVRSV
jgi:hypothetical protein